MLSSLNALLIRFEGYVHGWLVRHAITVLRVSMGAVFVGFGLLKFFPGASPAEGLVVTTIDLLSFGLIPASLALVLTATLECLIGIGLLIGRGLRLTIYLLAVQLLGILSPLVMLPGRLFSGPHHAPTLEGQYVLKDLILVAAAMVIATRFRGARITRPESSSEGIAEANRTDMRV
ncbi:DoxX family protein [Kribbella italica]|uniref:Putative membrane protein YkgB n=1 Tax=Kribbella italica TaxID=1540520 RepID=A0A7W9MRX1_9ACTN|nr:DoxX family protein [Kribbella italica]MBB5833313.1 putative membrane protein YkgB [Kribbella italica]